MPRHRVRTTADRPAPSRTSTRPCRPSHSGVIASCAHDGASTWAADERAAIAARRTPSTAAVEAESATVDAACASIAATI